MGAEVIRGRWGRLLSAEDAAEYLSISVTTLRDLDIASKGIGRRKLFDIRDLDRFVDRMSEPPPGARVEKPEADAVADQERRFFEGRRKRHAN